MRNVRLAVVLCVVSLAASGRALLAHHSFAADFDASKRVKVTGTVTKVEWTNPHFWFFVDVKNEDGSTVSWGFEMGTPNQLMRAGWRRDSMKVGDAVMVEGSAARDGTTKANADVVVLTSTGQRLFSGQVRQ